MINGLDSIGLTLQHEADISRYEAQQPAFLNYPFTRRPAGEFFLTSSPVASTTPRRSTSKSAG